MKVNSQFAICESHPNNLSLGMKSHNGMRPQDVVVLLKILGMEDSWLNKDLAKELYISNSEISESLNRSMIARLIRPDKRIVFKDALLDFLLHGLKYVFPAQPGGLVTGVPTAHSGPAMRDFFMFDNNYVWPSELGTTKGYAIATLYPNQAKAALEDPKLYEKLSLLDALRVGRAREREKAAELLKNSFLQQHAREHHTYQSR